MTKKRGGFEGAAKIAKGASGLLWRSQQVLHTVEAVLEETSAPPSMRQPAGRTVYLCSVLSNETGPEERQRKQGNQAFHAPWGGQTDGLQVKAPGLQCCKQRLDAPPFGVATFGVARQRRLAWPGLRTGPPPQGPGSLDHHVCRHSTTFTRPPSP
jgi:hypothetical protein